MSTTRCAHYKKGTAKSGRGGKGGKVMSRKQAIGLSKARKKGKKVTEEKVNPLSLSGTQKEPNTHVSVE